MTKNSKNRNDKEEYKCISVVGLGIIGSAISRHLIEASYAVVGFDIDARRCREAEGWGVSIADDAASSVAAVDMVLTSLPSDEALDEVVADVVSSAKDGKPAVIADLSTLSLACKIRNCDLLAKAGIAFLDCPISGTGAQAKTKDIVVFASGDKVKYDGCSRVFSDFSRKTRYLGAFGNGTKTKLIANLLVAIHNVATAEAVNLAKRAGLNLDVICEVIASGAGGSRIFELRAPLMAVEAYEPPTMKLDVWQKDMSLIADFAKACGAVTPLFSVTEPLYQAAVDQGRGLQDTAAVCAVLQEMEV